MQLSRIPLPTPESLAHRARIARLVSPLRRTRPRVPFYDLAAHRIPTLWSLYRGLLRQAPGQNIRFRVRMLFRRNEHLTSPAVTRVELVKGHKWLDTFSRARQGDVKLQAILRRYEQMLGAKRDKERWKRTLQEEMEWQKKLRNRPIMTGAYLRPSHSNGPLPRLKPQPIHISGMIHRRRKARERRLEQGMQNLEWRRDLKREMEFEMALAGRARSDGKSLEKVFQPHLADWVGPLQSKYDTIMKTYKLDEARQHLPYPPKMLEAIKQARWDRVQNKTRELERERHGEVLPRTIRRRNKGPPASVLAKMSVEERRLDKVARNVSEVGYVAAVKRRLGHKLRDPEAWKKEAGLPGDKARLNELLRGLKAENERRRTLADGAD